MCTMKQETIIQLHADFQAKAIQAEDGPEFWLGRDLQILLGYERWENFVRVIEDGKTACRTSGQEVGDHFRDTTKMVDIGSGSKREVADVAMTRYACYLVAQGGDSSKEQIAFAKTYFAYQTRNQELLLQRFAEIERLSAREKLTATEKDLSGEIFRRCGGDGSSFARIRSKGDQALFGGKTTNEMKKKLGVPEGSPLADRLPTITIKAKDFATELTNTTVRKDDLRHEGAITNEHIKNNVDVRNILKARGLTPENLPPAEDAQKVKRRIEAETKKLPKTIKKLTPSSDDHPNEPLLPS